MIFWHECMDSTFFIMQNPCIKNYPILTFYLVYVSIPNMLSFLNIMDYLHFYCAPCLLGKKPASLFSIPIEIYNKSQNEIESLRVQGFCIHFLYELNKKAHLLVFSEQKTRELFCEVEIKKAYEFFGYKDGFSFEDLKLVLFEKFSQFGCKELQQQNIDCFPHEVGLFLGYPPEDVLQYYTKKGRDYLFSGYWKVYTNPEKAIETFKMYDECRNHFMNGVKISFYNLLSA